MTARTHQLYLGQGTSPTVNLVIYTVPTGHRTIVKSVWVHNKSAQPGRLNIIIVRASDGQTEKLYDQPVLAAGSRAEVYPYWVLNEGDAIQIASTAGTSTANAYAILVSGVELVL